MYKDNFNQKDFQQLQVLKKNTYIICNQKQTSFDNIIMCSETESIDEETNIKIQNKNTQIFTQILEKYNFTEFDLQSLQ